MKEFQLVAEVSFKISLHYIVETCMEKDVLIKKSRSKLSLFHQKEQLHSLVSQ